MVDEIWVYSRFMARNIGASAGAGRRASATGAGGATHSGLCYPSGCSPGFLFLFVFDYLSTIQRKNPVGLIEAFKQCLRPGEGPQLLIKTINAPLRPSRRRRCCGPPKAAPTST